MYSHVILYMHDITMHNLRTLQKIAGTNYCVDHSVN